MKKLIYLLILAIIVSASIFAISIKMTEHDRISLFPLKNYDQTISTWINPSDPAFNKALISDEVQQKRYAIFINHYFGSISPWNADYVNKLFHQSSSDSLKSLELDLINFYNNENKSDEQIGYGENFRPYDKTWIAEVTQNINIAQFNTLNFQANHRGIAVDNLHVRALPTDDVLFYDYKIAGQGYPFDNLQMSSLWAGTPVYIVGETRDHVWMLVLTPDYIGWVKSNGIARVDDAFISTWINAAKNKLMAITHTETSLINRKNKFLFLAYVGSVFPKNPQSTDMEIMVPVADTNQHAAIEYAQVSNHDVVVMPLTATPHHFSDIMSTLIGRPYGWGNMYFYNDCSAELKNLFTPFGIWLPRHSADQVTAGMLVDMSDASKEQRLSYLMENGQRFMTIIYIGGHIVLYIGNYPNPKQPSSLMAMTYQDMWGLSPHPSIRRAVIGKAVLFPMLLQYPEDKSLISLADKKYFQVSYLNQLPNSGILMQEKVMDLKSLMFSE